MRRTRFASPSPLRPRHLCVALAALGGLGAVHAEEPALKLNPVVVTGSRAEAKSFDLPYSVDVVTQEQITEGQLGVNASEALSSVPGLVVQNRQNYAQDLQISSRGFGARAAFGVRGIKLIADGIPASTPDGQGQAATFDLDTAERIEVLRGPFATIYGASSGGVIQLFSRDGKGRPSISGGVIGGSWDTTKIDLGAEGEVGGVGYLLDLSRFDTNGYRDHSATTRDTSFAKLTLHPDEDSTLRIIASSLKQTDTQDPLGLSWDQYKDDPRGVDSAALDYNTRKSIDHKQGGLNYERRFGTGRLQLTAYAGERSVIQYQSIPSGPQGSPRHSGGVISFDRSFQGLGARWIQVMDAGPGALTVTGGVDYDRSQDDRQGYQNFIGSTLGVKGALRRDEVDTVTSLDPYAQASWKLDKWTLQAGVRHSHVKVDVNDNYIVAGNPDDGGEVSYRKTTPAVGISYQLTPAVNLYASAAKGFETPTVTEASYSGTGSSDGFNFGLKPSRSRQFEFGAKAFVGDYTRVNAAVFQIRTEDEIVVKESAGGRTIYQNASRTLRQGFELAADTEFSRQWSGRLAFTYLRAVYDQAFTSSSTKNNVTTYTTVGEGNRMPGIPKLSAFGEVAWKPRQGLSAALEALYRGHVEVNDANSERAAPAYTLFNLRLTADQQSGPWKISEMLRFDNLFDRHYIGSVIVGDGNGRFYEPGPTFSWYGGASARYTF